MAHQSSATQELDDMTECSICFEVFTDPRGLPCIHTFCLKCLLDYGKDKQPGDRMVCPLCMKEFTIPDDGLSGLQKNFYIEKLLHARKLSAEQEAQHIPCEGQLNQHFSRRPIRYKNRTTNVCPFMWFLLILLIHLKTV